MEQYNILEIFSERMQELINEKGWTVKEFAKNIGFPQATVNSWILKQRTAGIDKLHKIALFFGVTTDYLLGLEN